MSGSLKFYSLYATRFADNFGYVAILTLLPAYIELLDPTGLAIGLFISGLAIGRTLFGLPLGWAADRYDKRDVLFVSMGVSILAFVVFLIAETTTELIVARTLQGIGSIGAGMICLALVSELAPKKERASYIGIFNAWRLAAGMAGTLGVGAVFDYYGFDPIFGALIAMHAVAIVGVWWYTEPDNTRSSHFAYLDLALNRRLLTLTSFRAQYAISVTLVQTWVPIYVGVTAARGGLGLATFAVGSVLAAEKLMNMLFQPYTGQLSDRYGRELFIFVGGGLYGLIAIVVPFIPLIATVLPGPMRVPQFGMIPSVFIIALVLNGLLGIADSFREPASMALFADEGKGSGITSSFGIRGLVWRPGAIFAPILGGYLMTSIGIEWVFYTAGIFAFSGVGLFYGILFVRHGSHPFRHL